MTDAVLTKSYGAPPFEAASALRYAGMNTGTPEIDVLLEECFEELRGSLSYQVCFHEFPLSGTGESLDLGFAKTDSADLRRVLQDCRRIVLFAATIGLAPDRLIARYGKRSPSKAFLFQAIGTERIESLCDVFNAEIAAEAEKNGQLAVPRFSPGYGDLPLSLQKDIFRVLDCPRRIGLTLNASLLMTPTKSVTAIIGIRGTETGGQSDYSD